MNEHENEHENDLEDDALTLDNLIQEEEEKVKKESSEEQESQEENTEAKQAQAVNLAQKMNGTFWWGISKAYPMAVVPKAVYESGVESFVPLALEYADSVPEWAMKIIDRPEIKAGMYVGTAIAMARKTHFENLELQAAQEQQAQEEPTKPQTQAAQAPQATQEKPKPTAVRKPRTPKQKAAAAAGGNLGD